MNLSAQPPGFGHRLWRRSGAALAVVMLSALFLFVDCATPPIRLWDEARNIVNALEMDRDGFGLVTTYGGMADLWNTKPPLLIWLMAACARVFGPGEWALRLPSMAAGVGTALLLFWFVRRTLRSATIAAVSAAALVLSPAWFGEHSARTADYDALLVFFTTAYLCLLFLAVHRPRPAWALLLAIGVAIWCAAMTKSVAALVPGVGVVAYLVATARWRRLLAPRYIALAIGAVAALAAFLLLREAAAPGYLHAVWVNDLGGRFGSSLVPPKSRWFYLDALGAGYFSLTPLLVLSPLALIFAGPRQRCVLLFALCIVGAMLGVCTAAASKLNHYILPAVPFMAIAAAICLHVLVGRARAASRSKAPLALLLTAAVLLTAIVPVAMGVAGAVARRYFHPIIGEGARSGEYGALFDRIANADRPILVVDPGFVRDGDDRHFAPVLLAYRTIWSLKGVRIGHAIDLSAIDRQHGRILASCDPLGAARIAARGPDIAHVPGCAAVSVD